MYSRMTAMIMAVLPHKDGAPNPNRHIHAGRAREWAMIMGVAHLEGGRTSPPTRPARPRALWSSGPLAWAGPKLISPAKASDGRAPTALGVRMPTEGMIVTVSVRSADDFGFAS
jgi:hypothetical protein